MSIHRGMDKEGMVHIHNRILLSHKKEQKSPTCRNVDGTETVIQREVRKRKEKEKNKYKISLMWNLGKWYRCTYLQNLLSLLSPLMHLCIFLPQAPLFPSRVDG